MSSIYNTRRDELTLNPTPNPCLARMVIQRCMKQQIFRVFLSQQRINIPKKRENRSTRLWMSLLLSETWYATNLRIQNIYPRQSHLRNWYSNRLNKHFLNIRSALAAGEVLGLRENSDNVILELVHPTTVSPWSQRYSYHEFSPDELSGICRLSWWTKNESNDTEELLLANLCRKLSRNSWFVCCLHKGAYRSPV